MMFKKVFARCFVLFALMPFATACTFRMPWSAQTAQSSETDQAGLETKLAIGTLMLEDTDLAVTAEQAKQLLPLWKAVRSLSSSDTVSQAEIQALYDQIQEAMSAEQIRAIQTMEITPQETQALMQKLGIEGGGFMAGGSNLSENDIATRTAERQNSGGGFPGGMPMGGPDMMGGGPPPEMGGGQSNTQLTPVAGRQRMNGMNLRYIAPLIRLLEERAKG